MNRIVNIASTLLSTKQPVTIDAIAEELNVSNRTIRYDLKKLEEIVESVGLTLYKKTGVGISIVGPEDKKIKLVKKVSESLTSNIPFSPQDRKNYILRKLIMLGQSNICITEIANELFVSRATVYKDLTFVEEWLANYNLKVVKEEGLSVFGKEDDLRNAIASLLTLYNVHSVVENILRDENENRIDNEAFIKIKNLINVDYKKLEKIVIKVEEELKFRFSEEAFISLIIHIAIAIKRLKEGKEIRLSSDLIRQLLKNKEFNISKKMAKNIEMAFEVKLPDDEICYIQLHIISAKKHENKPEGLKLHLKTNENMAVLMAKEIIEISERALSLDLNKDKQLFNGLVLHLKPTINRLKYGLTLRNPILDEIKMNYPDIYGVAWITSTVFEKYLDQQIQEEEIGYIALHICAAVERNKHNFNVLIVCHSGLGTSQLLSAKLKRSFRQIQIKDVISSINYTEKCLEDVDFVISTVPITMSRPVLEVNPILTELDIKTIEDFMENLRSGTQLIRDRVIIDDDMVRIEQEVTNKNKAIRRMCNMLYKKGYVSKKFEGEVLNREKIKPTVIGHGIAIPHGLPETVNQSCISATVFRKPIKWGNEQVCMVLMVCISKKDIPLAKKIFGKLYEKINLITNDKTCESINTKKELREFLEGLR